MGRKDDLVEEAEELGIEVKSGDTIPVLEEKISAAEAEKAEEEKSLMDVSYLRDNCQAILGQPRSVFVGAMSAGLIKGDRITKEAAAQAVQDFLNRRIR